MKDNSEAVAARKVVQLFQLPRILVLHLKRFAYTHNGTGKIHKPIHYGERLRCAFQNQIPFYCGLHVRTTLVNSNSKLCGTRALPSRALSSLAHCCEGEQQAVPKSLPQSLCCLNTDGKAAVVSPLCFALR